MNEKGFAFVQKDVEPQKAQKAQKTTWHTFVVKISGCPALLRFASESARLRTRFGNKAVTATGANQSYSLSKSNMVSLNSISILSA